MSKVYLSLGSNISPQHNLIECACRLAGLLSDLRCSPVYQSPALGIKGDDFLNAVVEGNTVLPCSADGAKELWGELREIEQALGRDRALNRFSSRSIDIDLLLYDNLVLSEYPPLLPREEIYQHAFVVQPLVDLTAHGIHPVSKDTFSEILASLKKTDPGQFSELRSIELDLMSAWSSD